MRAAVLNRVKEIEMKEIAIPRAGRGEVVIKVHAVGLCGSDIHYYEHGRVGRYEVKQPIILGHEASGEIVEAGEGAEAFHEGQRVTIEPGMPCRNCSYCAEGRYNLCPDVEFLATPPFDGAFSEYIAMRADAVFPIPEEMSYAAAALIEPFSVGLHAAERADIKPGDTVIIMGMGPIGMMTAAAAEMHGAAQIIGVDFEKKRLETAKKFGVTDTIDLQTQTLEKSLHELTQGAKADRAIETAGSPKAVEGTISSVKRGGTIAVVGMPPEDYATINISQIVDGEIDFKGVFRYRNTYKKAIRLLAKSELQLEDMVTGTFPLGKAEAAFQQAVNDKANTLKLIIEPQK